MASPPDPPAGATKTLARLIEAVTCRQCNGFGGFGSRQLVPGTYGADTRSTATFRVCPACGGDGVQPFGEES